MSKEYLWKNITQKAALILAATGKLECATVFSATRSKETLQPEFGDHCLRIDLSSQPFAIRVIAIQYDIAWFIQSDERKNLLVHVTGRTEQEWLDWATREGAQSPGELIDMLDAEIEALYASEAEVVVFGLPYLSADFVQIIEDDIERESMVPERPTA